MVKPGLGGANKLALDIALPALIFTSLSTKAFTPFEVARWSSSPLSDAQVGFKVALLSTLVKLAAAFFDSEAVDLARSVPRCLDFVRLPSPCGV